MAPGGASEPPGGRKQISGSGHYWRLVSGGRGSSAKRCGRVEVLKVQWRLAARAGAPGGSGEWRLAAGRSSLGGDGAVMILQAPGAWRCVMPAKRFEPSVCLATWDARQAVLVQWWCTRKSLLHRFKRCSWCDALAGGPVTSVSCIGVTRDHSRL